MSITTKCIDRLNELLGLDLNDCNTQYAMRLIIIEAMEEKSKEASLGVARTVVNELYLYGYIDQCVGIRKS